MTDNAENEIYFEIVPIGNNVKITAIDAMTGTEAVTFGPAGVPVEILKKNAMKKLEYVLNKKASAE